MNRPREPHYDLVLVQEFVRAGVWHMTLSARAGMADVGFRSTDVRDCVLSLALAHFKKSMSAERRPGFYQDVYNINYDARALYVKLQIENVDPDATVVVISFKAL